MHGSNGITPLRIRYTLGARALVAFTSAFGSVGDEGKLGPTPREA